MLLVRSRIHADRFLSRATLVLIVCLPALAWADGTMPGVGFSSRSWRSSPVRWRRHGARDRHCRHLLDPRKPRRPREGDLRRGRRRPPFPRPAARLLPPGHRGPLMRLRSAWVASAATSVAAVLYARTGIGFPLSLAVLGCVVLAQVTSSSYLEGCKHPHAAEPREPPTAGLPAGRRHRRCVILERSNPAPSAAPGPGESLRDRKGAA